MHEHIRALSARYCRSLDRRALTDFQALFWPDAVLGSPLVGGDFHGHDGLADFFERLHGGSDFERFRSGRHTTGNVILDEVTSREVAAWSQFQLFVAPEGAPMLSAYGEYHDRLTERGGQWRFSRRDIVLLATV